MTTGSFTMMQAGSFEESKQLGESASLVAALRAENKVQKARIAALETAMAQRLGEGKSLEGRIADCFTKVLPAAENNKTSVSQPAVTGDDGALARCESVHAGRPGLKTCSVGIFWKKYTEGIAQTNKTYWKNWPISATWCAENIVYLSHSHTHTTSLLSAVPMASDGKACGWRWSLNAVCV